MNQGLAAADAALKAGRRDEAIELLAGVLSDDPAQGVEVGQPPVRHGAES